MRTAVRGRLQAVAEERRKREKLKSRLVSVGREAEELRLQVSRLQAEVRAMQGWEEGDTRAT